MKLRLVILALLIFQGARAFPQARLTDAQLHYNEGNDLYGKGQLDGAIAEYRQAIRLKPEYAEAHSSLGHALADKGNLDGAIAEYLEANRLKPDDAVTHYNLANALNHKGDYQSALAYYNVALRLDPKNAEAYVGAGDALRLWKKDWDGAIQEYREAIRLDPKNQRAHEYLGVALGAKGDWDGEIAEEREALLLDPKNESAHHYLGVALGAKGDWDGEIAEEREALRMNPENKDANSALNHALRGKKGELDDPIGEFNEAIYRYSSLLVVGVGLFYFMKGFRVYRELRVFEDTPEVPIRSVAMGFTHIHGNSEGGQTVPGPVSKQPCYFYKVSIERWQTDSKGGKHWSKCATDADGVRFSLADAIGKVLVDAHGAEFDLPQSGQRETLTAGRSLRNVFDSVSWCDADKELGAYIERASPGSKPGRYRLTEVTILPHCSYDVIGTCVENPQARDEHDRNMIVKGQNEQTFLISRRAEKEVEQRMRKKALLYVFGGAGLAIVCLVVFLAMSHWI